MNRPDMMKRARARSKPWDIIVIGGGATGVGIAIDAASRQYDVLLIDRSDFGKGTSSRSTKLVHGGVRYLQQGNLPLVMEALKERERLFRNAPHLVSDLEFVIPAYRWWERPYYGPGLKIYDVLAGKSRFGSAEFLSRKETIERLPNVRETALRGGVLYHDGQFDDARLLISMVCTAAAQGATLLNYAGAVSLSRNSRGTVNGVGIRDEESGDEFHAEGNVVINATGPFCDEIRRLADPSANQMVAPSQGIHLVVDKRFLGGGSALVVPRTPDGRILFGIPWHDHALLGTTDTPIAALSEEPVAMDQEIDFVLETAGQYLREAPTRKDVLSVFAGIRPLIQGEAEATAALARDHRIQVESSGLLTITGGKWTTYRHMAEQCVDRAATLGGLSPRTCVTATLPLRGPDREGIRALAAADRRLLAPLHPELPYTGADVIWAVRSEMARTMEDVLARRTRALFLRARATIAMAPAVAELMAGELGWNGSRSKVEIDRFWETARNYVLA